MGIHSQNAPGSKPNWVSELPNCLRGTYLHRVLRFRSPHCRFSMVTQMAPRKQRVLSRYTVYNWDNVCFRVHCQGASGATGQNCVGNGSRSLWLPGLSRPIETPIVSITCPVCVFPTPYWDTHCFIQMHNVCFSPDFCGVVCVVVWCVLLCVLLWCVLWCVLCGLWGNDEWNIDRTSSRKIHIQKNKLSLYLFVWYEWKY